MKKHRLTIFIFSLMLLQSANIFAQQAGKTEAIYSGLPWYDQNGKVVSAHGANIVQQNGKFYLFGEAHSDTSNAFAGFNCYSSKDLYNWKFESVALPVQKNGKLGPNRVGERVKVMKNPFSGEFIMLMHVDTLGYKDQFVGYATAKNIAGPYQFKGPLLFKGKPIKKWDMGTFQDDDGTGYLLTHGGMIHQLSKDYKSIIAEINPAITTGFESPTLFRKNNTYYFIGSHLTSWEKNDNYYYTSKSLSGPWTARGLLAPKDKLTWNSQATFILKISGTKDTTFMFMGDRWSFPKQLSSATYVWQPITFKGDSISIPQYLNAWTVNLNTGTANSKSIIRKTILPGDQTISLTGNWKSSTIDSISIIRSDETKASLSFNFSGKQIGLYAVLLPDNGYAKVEIRDKKGKIIINNIIDLYSKSPMLQLAFLSPMLPKSDYKVTVSVLGERPNWSDKRKSLYGSTGNNITIAKLIIQE